ncbi:hypothetical protein V8C37DRAFT_384361 [Trichoderma ceciliae]
MNVAPVISSRVLRCLTKTPLCSLDLEILHSVDGITRLDKMCETASRFVPGPRQRSCGHMLLRHVCVCCVHSVLRTSYVRVFLVPIRCLQGSNVVIVRSTKGRMHDPSFSYVLSVTNFPPACLPFALALWLAVPPPWYVFSSRICREKIPVN